MFMEIGTGLGPPLIRCTSCSAVFDSGSTEWIRLTDYQKKRYIILSIFYAIIEGMIIAILPTEIISWLLNPSNPSLLPMSTFRSMFLMFYIIGIIIILGFQALRVVHSIKRVRNNIRKPMDVSKWTWETNPQGFWSRLDTINIAAFCIIAFVLF